MPNNYRFIHYADVVLMYAEGLNETVSAAAAYEFIDCVKERARLAPLSQVRPA